MSEVSSGGAPAPVAAPESAASPSEVNTSGEVSQQEFSGEQHSSENIGEVAEQLQDAVEAGELSQAEAAKMIKKFQLKVKGQLRDVEVDLSDDNFLKNQFQLAEMSKMAMQEKAEQEKLFRELINKGKGDPLSFIKELYGIDPDELAAAHIEKKIEHLKKSPELLEKERIQEELRQAREEAKKLKEEKENAEMSKLQQEALVGLKEEISSAIKEHTKLPNSDYVQKKFAQALQWAVDNGYPDATAEDVAMSVEAEMRAEYNKLADELPEEVLESFIGKKNLQRIKSKNIAKMKQAPTTLSAVKPTAASVNKPADNKPVEKIHAKDFWRRR